MLRRARAVATVLLAGLAAANVAETESIRAQAEVSYAQRADGSTGGIANPERIDHAIALYRRALQESPESLEVLAGLLRALHFKGAFCGAPLAERRAVFEEAKNLGQAAVERLERPLAGPPEQARISRLREQPGAAGVYFWTAACWGQWALVRGKLAAARQGVAGKIRDLADAVIAIDPGFEEGGGYRVLGRLHHQSPKIPFITGWVSKQKAVQYLRESLAIEPRNAVTRFFLAEAILDHDANNLTEARRLLLSCADDPPRPEFLIEERSYAEEARALLKRLR